MEQTTLQGTVVGDAGKAVAGWVSLGPNQPQHWVATSFAMETADGLRVEIDGLEPHTIEPVVRTKAKWIALEGNDLATLCRREAPSPDTDVVLTSGVVRGGESIVVWGAVAERDGSGGEIARVSAFAIGHGDDPAGALDAARLRYIDKQRDKQRDQQRDEERARAPSELPLSSDVRGRSAPIVHPVAPTSSGTLVITLLLIVAILGAGIYALIFVV